MLCYAMLAQVGVRKSGFSNPDVCCEASAGVGGRSHQGGGEETAEAQGRAEQVCMYEYMYACMLVYMYVCILLVFGILVWSFILQLSSACVNLP